MIILNNYKLRTNISLYLFIFIIFDKIKNCNNNQLKK